MEDSPLFKFNERVTQFTRVFNQLCPDPQYVSYEEILNPAGATITLHYRDPSGLCREFVITSGWWKEEVGG